MRILFFTTKLNFETGGGSVSDSDIKVRAMKLYGHDVRAVTLFPGINRGVEHAQYPVIEERIGTSGQLAIQWGAYKMLKKYEATADVFHVDGSVFLYGAGLYRMFGGKTPVVVGLNREQSSFASYRKPKEPPSFSRALASLRRNIRHIIERTLGVYIANYADRFTFSSPILRDFYIRFGLNAKKCFWFFDFLDADDALRHKRVPRVRSKNEFVILTGGRMVWDKGLDIVLAAVAQMKNREGVRVIMAGEGLELKPLKKFAQELGLQDVVQFTGWLSMKELYGWLQKADCFIVPCWRKEIASALTFYAAAVGVPAIVPAGGALEWLAGGAALTFEDQNAADLAVKIEQLIQDEKLRAKLIERGFVRARELDYRGPAKELDKILRSVIASEFSL